MMIFNLYGNFCTSLVEAGAELFAFLHVLCYFKKKEMKPTQFLILKRTLSLLAWTRRKT